MKYVTVSKVYTGRKHTGFEFVNERSEKISVSLDQMDKIIADPDVELDIAKHGKGWKFKDSGKSMSMIPVVRSDKTRASIKPIKTDGIEYFMGQSLVDMIKVYRGVQPVRSECTISKYLDSVTNGTVCIVSGLHCTGKRTMVRYEVQNSKMFESTVWFKIAKKNVNHKSVEEIYKNYCKTCKTIVIEDADNIYNLHRADWIRKLADKGNKVVLITKGDTFYKNYSESVFYNHVYSVYTTPVTYSDYAYMNRESDSKISFIDYSHMGELNFNPNRYVDEETGVCDMEYFNGKPSIIDDIRISLAPNNDAMKWLGFTCDKKGVTELRTIIFILLNSIINNRYDVLSVGDVHKIKFANILRLYDTSVVRDADALAKQVCNNLGVDYNKTFDGFETGRILRAMEHNKIIAHLANLQVNNTNRPFIVGKYYFTNPSILNRFFWEVYKEIDKQYIPRDSNFDSHINYGFMYESAVVTNIMSLMKENGAYCYFFKDSNGREVDSVIYKMDHGVATIILCEIKSCGKADAIIRRNNLKWIGDAFFNIYMNKRFSGKIQMERLVVYPGEDMEIQDVEGLKSVKFVNTEKFLNTLWQRLSAIEL